MSFICHIHNYTEYNEEWNVFSAFNPSKCTHLEQWAADCAAPGEQLWTSCQRRDSNPQPWVTSGFKSNAPSIRPTTARQAHQHHGHLHLHLADAFIQSNLQCIQVIHLYCQYVCSLGIEPTTFALLTQCSNHWATGTHVAHLNNFWSFWQCGQVPNPAGKWNQHI